MLYARAANIQCDRYYSNFLEVKVELKKGLTDVIRMKQRGTVMRSVGEELEEVQCAIKGEQVMTVALDHVRLFSSASKNCRRRKEKTKQPSR